MGWVHFSALGSGFGLGLGLMNFGLGSYLYFSHFSVNLH